MDKERLTCAEYEALKKHYFNGWKTWNVNSVLSWVHMPDALTLKLSVKEYQSGHYLPDALIGRLPDPTGQSPEEVVTPGDHAIDDSYTSLHFSWCGLSFLVETAEDHGNYYVLVTPQNMQVRPALLVLEAGYLWNRPGVVQREGQELAVSQQGVSFRIGCSASVFDQDLNLPCICPYLSIQLSTQTAFWVEQADSRSAAKTLEEIQNIVRDKEATLHRRYDQYGDLAWMMQAMECVVAWDTVFDPGHGRVVSPVSRLWSIRSGGYVLFCWDNYFAGYMAALLGSRELSYSNLIEITSEHTKDGFVPNFVWGTGQKSADRSQPPVGAAMLLGVYKIFKEKWLVRLLFPSLLEWNDWFWTHRKSPTGAFCWGSDPIPVLYGNIWETDGVHGRYGAALESGMDNSPMYDDIPFNQDTSMLELEDVGLTGLYIMDCDALIELARILDETDCVGILQERKDATQKGLEHLWDEEYGFYCNRRTDTGEFSHRISPTNFYAFFSDQIDPVRIQRILEEHYYNEKEFYGEWMLPSIARCDPAFRDQDYWRGRVWAPLNFLTYLAMKKQGCEKECHDLAGKSRHIIQKEWEEHRHVHENYNAITGEGCDVLNSDKFYHWGALLSVIALMDRNYL